jgi:hypothetical protein
MGKEKLLMVSGLGSFNEKSRRFRSCAGAPTGSYSDQTGTGSNDNKSGSDDGRSTTSKSVVSSKTGSVSPTSERFRTMSTRS